MRKTLFTKLMLLMAVVLMGAGTAWAEDTESVTFSEQYSNQDKPTYYKGTDFTLAFSKGEGSSAPQYYDTGAALRLYAKNTMTVSTTKTIKKIVLTFGNGDSTNEITTGVGTYTDGTWEGSESEVVFTVGGTKGHRRIASVTVTFASSSGGGDTPSDLEDSDFALTDAPVALTFDLYNNYTAQTISYYTSSTGEVTVDGQGFVSAYVDEDNKTITVTPMAKTNGEVEITVNQAADEDYKAGSATFTVTITDSTPIPTHTVTFSVNGTTTTQDFEEGAAIVFPTDPTDIEGKQFVGWTESAISGTTDVAPAFVTTATMGNSDVTYYAVFATVEGSSSDESLEITAETEGVPSSYGSANTFSEYTLGGVKFQIMQMYKSGGKLQWRAGGNSSGTGTMYNSESLGKIKSVVLTYNSSDNNKNFTLTVGSSANPTEGQTITPSENGSVYTFDCSSYNYGYFVLTNGTNAGYLDKLEINYVVGSSTISGYCTTVAADTRLDAGLAFSETVANASIGQEFTAPTLNTAEGFNGAVEYSSSDETVAQVMDSETGELRLVAEGTTVITATFAGNDDYKAGSASYTLTVTDNRIATTITQDNIEIDLADVATLTQLTPVVKDASDNVVEYTNSPEGDGLPDVYFEIVGEDTDGIIGSLDSHGNIVINSVTGTVTIKAVFNYFQTIADYQPSECTFTLTIFDPNAPGTENNPYTVAQAIAATPTTGEVYISGIVSSFYNTSIVGDGSNYRYYISDDGTTDTELLVYKGKGLNQETFSDADDLKVGDEVVIYGKLTMYQNAPEVASGNYLVSLNRPADTTPSISLSTKSIEATAEGADGTITVTYNNLTDVVAEVQFFAEDGTTSATYDWITADINNDNNVEYLIDTNDGAARTAYMKVYAVGNEGEATSELITITQAKYVVATTYTLASEIVSGKHYVFASGTDGNVSAMGKMKSTNREAVAVTANNGTIALTGEEGAYEFVIAGPDANGNYTIYDESTESTGYLYAAGGTGNNHLKVQTTNDANGQWSISIDEEGVATIKAKMTGSDSDRNWMRYNSSSAIFSCYNASSNQKDIYLYERDGEATPTETVKVTTAKYATYCSENALDFEGTGVTAYIAKMEGTTVKFTEVKKVPAYEGVLLKADVNSDTEFTVSATTSKDDVTGNVLVGVTKETTLTTDPTNGIFVLMNGTSGVGFYKTKGSSFTLRANSAYLPANVVSEARSFIGFDGETTGIKSLTPTLSEGEGAYFDLQGRRVMQPTKGLYIVNGKKVIKN